MSLSAYARRRGVSVEAVRKAVIERRLEEAVVMVRGKAKIADAELADREWAERTRPPAVTIEDHEAAMAAESGDGVDDGGPTVGDGEIPARTRYFEAMRIRTVELARRERIKREADALDLAKRKGELVSAAEAKGAVADLFGTVKTKLLGVPKRVKQRLPHIALEDVRVVDELIREALEELADGRI